MKIRMESTNETYDKMNDNHIYHDNDHNYDMTDSTLYAIMNDNLDSELESSHRDDSNMSNHNHRNHDDDQTTIDATDNHEENEDKENEMTIEERQIHDSLITEHKKAHTKLQATLDSVRETTRSMLNEIQSFLASTESVMIDYTKCQNSQRNEARRLEEVEPDVVGATEMYLEKMKGLIEFEQKPTH